MSAAEVVIDDEMEAMLREIESMGMEPEAPAGADEATSSEEMAAVVAAIQEDDDLDAAVAAIEEENVVKKEVSVKAMVKEVPVEVEIANTVVDPDAEAPAAIVTKPATVEVKAAGPTPTDPENVVKKPAPKALEARVARSAADDLIDSEQVKRDIGINLSDLDTMLVEHPGLQLHYGLKTADARRAYERIKSGVEILEAKLDASYREKLGDGVKKPTEAAIRNALVADASYASAQAKLIDARHVWQMCEAIENSFHGRKDILLEVARDRRKEKEGAMRVMDDSELRAKVTAMMTK